MLYYSGSKLQYELTVNKLKQSAENGYEWCGLIDKVLSFRGTAVLIPDDLFMMSVTDCGVPTCCWNHKKCFNYTDEHIRKRLI
jgi:hypothetical protein